jgi:hypothetical protein
MRAASDDDESTPDAGGEDTQVAVGARVRVHSGTDTESLGVIVEDFGEMHGLDVRVGANQIANAARRWAVALDDGTLVFVDSDQITAD